MFNSLDEVFTSGRYKPITSENLAGTFVLRPTLDEAITSDIGAGAWAGHELDADNTFDNEVLRDGDGIPGADSHEHRKVLVLSVLGGIFVLGALILVSYKLFTSMFRHSKNVEKTTEDVNSVGPDNKSRPKKRESVQSSENDGTKAEGDEEEQRESINGKNSQHNESGGSLRSSLQTLGRNLMPSMHENTRASHEIIDEFSSSDSVLDGLLEEGCTDNSGDSSS